MYVIPIGNVSTGGHGYMHFICNTFSQWSIFQGLIIVYVIWLQVDNYVCDMCMWYGDYM